LGNRGHYFASKYITQNYIIILDPQGFPPLSLKLFAYKAKIETVLAKISENFPEFLRAQN
jgi:hypothetical protein